MARSTRDGCPSPDPAFLRPSYCLCPGSSSASPASSPDSGGSSPAYRGWRAAGGRARLGGGQRQSASQREKLRMRRLAQALHALRRYLPASVAPAGQSLTKIETLRLAIRYIGHLSALLGLGPEPRPPPHLPEPRLAPAAPARLEREPWRAAPAPGCGPGGRAGAALLPAELPAAPPPPACQSLPDELLSFLEDFFPLAAPGGD